MTLNQETENELMGERVEMERFAPYRWVAVGEIVLLAIALGDRPYGYYAFLRWASFITFLYCALFAIILKKPLWAITLACVGLLFNPFVPVYLDKETWVVIDIVAGLLLLVSIFVVRESAVSD